MSNLLILNILFYENRYSCEIIAAVIDIDKDKGVFFFLLKGDEERLKDNYHYWDVDPVITQSLC